MWTCYICSVSRPGAAHLACHCRQPSQQPEMEEPPAAASPIRMPVIKDPPPPPPPRATPPALVSPNSAAVQQVAPLPTAQPGPSDTNAAGRTAAPGVGNAWVAAPEADQVSAPVVTVKSKSVPAAVPANGQAVGAKAAAALAGAPPPGLAPKAVPAPAAPQNPPDGTSATVPVLEPGSLMMMLQDKRPHPFDGVWHRYACSRRTRASRPCPASYPKVPLAILEMSKFYSSIPKDNDLDLFTIFYLTPGTHYQYLAACELRHRNWRCEFKSSN